MPSKKPWQSKTLWVNVLVAVAAIAYPPAKVFIEAHPEAVAIGFALLNSLLRLITSTPIVISDDVKV